MESNGRLAAGWLPLLALPTAVALSRASLPPWGFMWTMAAAIGAGCKWLTWRRSRERGHCWDRSIGYLLSWPGMDADAFLGAGALTPRPRLREWAGAGLKTLLGVAILWAAVRLIPAHRPLVAGWVGMAGIAFVLHFGVFHLAALFWQARGVRAEPIMRCPARAASLGEFWGARWNRGFNDLAARFVFHPLRSRIGVAGATLGAFLASGLVHELVISFPARGGYGLPTAYFLAQGFGVLAERSAFGKRCGLRRGWRGWILMVALTAGPAFWLFHPAFVLRVIHPFLEVIGAL